MSMATRERQRPRILYGGMVISKIKGTWMQLSNMWYILFVKNILYPEDITLVIQVFLELLLS